MLDPDAQYIEKVRVVSDETGDSSRISEADASLLALALQLEATLVTDDYSMQNVASILGIDIQNIEKEGIKGIWKWQWTCRKCKKKLDGPGECEICGGDAYKRSRKLISRSDVSSAGKNE